MSAESIVVNPILVQGYHPDPCARNALGAVTPEAHPAAWEAVSERMRQQAHVGGRVDRYFDLANPTTQRYLRPSHLSDLRIARLSETAIGSTSMLYLLAETAVMCDDNNTFADLWCTDTETNKLALLRIEEGLTGQANEIGVNAINHATEIVSENGKTVVRLPGHRSKVPVKGWWVDNADGSRRFLDSVPSCETFMSAVILDQAQYGDCVVRVVPAGMEDREVAAYRMLALAGHVFENRSMVAIISSPNGDIKKVRRWGGLGTPEPISELVKEHRVDAKAASVASSISTLQRKQYRTEYDELQLSCAERSVFKSPNTEGLTAQERLRQFLDGPYSSYPLLEITHPNPQDIVDVLALVRELSNTIDTPVNKVGYSNIVGELHAGKNTNNVYVLTYNMELSSTKRGTLSIRTTTVFTRVNDDDFQLFNTAQNIPNPQADAYLEVVAQAKPYYILVEGIRKEAVVV